jgi:hypothetical protein
MKKGNLVSIAKTAGSVLAGIVVFLNFECMSSNMQPLNPNPTTNTSFNSYLDSARNQFGDNYLSNIIASVTYPGARIGASIHNYNLPDDNNNQK